MFKRKREDVDRETKKVEELVPFNESSLSFLNGRVDILMVRKIVSRVITLPRNLSAPWNQTKLKQISSTVTGPHTFCVEVEMEYFELSARSLSHLGLDGEEEKDVVEDVIFNTVPTGASSAMMSIIIMFKLEGDPISK